MAAEDVAEIVGVGAVGEHVGHLEFAADFGVRVARHDDGDFAATEVVGLGFAFEHAFDLAGAVAEGDEFLQELGVRVLDVIDVDHDIVAHFEGEVEFFDLSEQMPAKPNSEKMSQDIKQHAKFHKFIKGNN